MKYINSKGKIEKGYIKINLLINVFKCIKFLNLMLLKYKIN